MSYKVGEESSGGEGGNGGGDKADKAQPRASSTAVRAFTDDVPSHPSTSFLAKGYGRMNSVSDGSVRSGVSRSRGGGSLAMDGGSPPRHKPLQSKHDGIADANAAFLGALHASSEATDARPFVSKADYGSFVLDPAVHRGNRHLGHPPQSQYPQPHAAGAGQYREKQFLAKEWGDSQSKRNCPSKAEATLRDGICRVPVKN